MTVVAEDYTADPGRSSPGCDRRTGNNERSGWRGCDTTAEPPPMVPRRRDATQLPIQCGHRPEASG